MTIIHNMTHKIFMSVKMINGTSYFFQNGTHMRNNKIQF